MARLHDNQSRSYSSLPGNSPTTPSPVVAADLCDLMQANHCHTPCVEQRKPTFGDLELRLLNAGITPELLIRQWGITLWSIRPKSDRIKLKVQAKAPIQIHELEQWFAEILGQPVSISQKPFSECCLSPCKGCLWADPEKRAFWSGTNQKTHLEQ